MTLLWLALRPASLGDRESGRPETTPECQRLRAAAADHRPRHVGLETAIRAIETACSQAIDVPHDVGDDDRFVTWLAADEAFQRKLSDIHAKNDERYLRVMASREHSLTYQTQAMLVTARTGLRCIESRRRDAVRPGMDQSSARPDECDHAFASFSTAWAEFQGTTARFEDVGERSFWMRGLTRAADEFRSAYRESLDRERSERSFAPTPSGVEHELGPLRAAYQRLRAAAHWMEPAAGGR